MKNIMYSLIITGLMALSVLAVLPGSLAPATADVQTDTARATTYTLTSGVAKYASVTTTTSGKYDYFKITVSSAPTSIVAELDTVGTDDLDVYYKYGGYPSTTSYHLKATTSSPDETLSLTSTYLTTGTHYFRVQRYSGTGTDYYYFKVTVTTGGGGGSDDGGALTAGTAANGYMDSADGSDMWYIDVPSGIASMDAVLTCGTADFDLYGKFNAQPTTSSYDWRGYTSGGEECTVTSPAQGRHYIMVDYYSGSGAYTLTVTLTTGGGGTGDWGTGGKYAIIVGISNYQSISDLSYCDEDARDWYNFLTSKGYECHVYYDGSYTSNSFTSIPAAAKKGYATEANVRAAVQGLAAHAVAGNQVAFVTSGHGSGTGTGSSYLCMYDCSGSAGCYYDTELKADFGLFVSGVKTFIFVDHCYSGGLGPEIMSLANKAYFYMTTTCTQDGYGYDYPTGQNGAWTYYFLELNLKNSPSQSMEVTFDNAAANYPYSGGDAPMEFDGNTGSSFYL